MTGSGQVSPCLATQHQYASRDVPELHGRFERSQRAGTIVARTVRITPLCACLAMPHQIVSPFGTVTRRSQLVPVGLAKGSADPRAYRQSKVNNSWLAKAGNQMRPASRTLHRCRPPAPPLRCPSNWPASHDPRIVAKRLATASWFTWITSLKCKFPRALRLNG